MSERVGVIYGLHDPVTGELRYVGATAQRPEMRLRGHVVDARRGCKTHRGKWIRSVLAEGKDPEMRVILADIPETELWLAEQREIAAARARGCRLTNGTDGGDGLLGHSMTEADRRRMVLAAKDKRVVEDILDAIHPERVDERMEEQVRKYRAANPARPVIDDLGRTYPSVYDAASALRVSDVAVTRHLKGKQSHVARRVLRWADE